MLLLLACTTPDTETGTKPATTDSDTGSVVDTVDTGGGDTVDTVVDTEDTATYELPDLDWSGCALAAPRVIADAEDLWTTVDPFTANIAALTLMDVNVESFAPEYCVEEEDGDATTWYAPCFAELDQWDFTQGSYRVEGDTVTYADFVLDDFNGHWALHGSWTSDPVITWALTMDISQGLQGLVEVAGEVELDGDLVRIQGQARTTGAFVNESAPIPDGDFCVDLHLDGSAGWLAAHSANDVVAVYGEDGCGRLFVDGVDVGETCQ